MKTIKSDTAILYSFRRCPYAIRARMAIKYSGLSVALREVSLSDKPDELLAISPKGTVPVLLLPDETVIDESIDIIHWALKQHDPEQWSPKNALLADETRKLIHQNDALFKPHLDKYKYADRHPQYPLEYYREQAEIFPALLDKKLKKTGFLQGHSITLADIAIFPFIRQFAHVDKIWFEQTQYQNLQYWLQYFLDSEIFTCIMKKYPVWNKDIDEYILF